MTFSQYQESAEFQKLLLHRRRGKKKWIFDLVSCALLALLCLAETCLVNYLPHEGTLFLSLAISIACGILLIFIAELVVNIRTRGSDDDRPFLYGFLLYMRELNVDFSAYVQNGVLAAELFLGGDWRKNADKLRKVTLGSGEHAVLLDFTPWGSVEALKAYQCVGIGLLEYLSERQFPALETVSVQWRFEGNAFTEKSDLAKPYYLFKKGKWTLEGRFLRSYLRYARKKAEKLK